MKVTRLLNACPRCKSAGGFNKDHGPRTAACNKCGHVWLSTSDLTMERSVWLANLEMQEDVQSMEVDDLVQTMTELVASSQETLVNTVYDHCVEQYSRITDKINGWRPDDGGGPVYNFECGKQEAMLAFINFVDEMRKKLKTGEIVE